MSQPPSTSPESSFFDRVRDFLLGHPGRPAEPGEPSPAADDPSSGQDPEA